MQLDWEIVRQAILDQAAELVRVLQSGAGRREIDLVNDPIWSLYWCPVCGRSRVGLARVLRCMCTLHRPPTIASEVASGVPWGAARQGASLRNGAFGLFVPRRLYPYIPRRDRKTCVARLMREMDAGCGVPIVQVNRSRMSP